MADKGTAGPGLKVIANGRTLPTEEAYDENSIHKVCTYRCTLNVNKCNISPVSSVIYQSNYYNIPGTMSYLIKL